MWKQPNLNEYLEKEVYMDQCECFSIERKGHIVCQCNDSKFSGIESCDFKISFL